MDGPPPPEEDFSALPIPERLTHKNWKARVSAYETLVKLFQTTASDTDPAFKPYLNNPDLLKKIVTDSNAVAQEKGVECLVAFVKYAGETATKTREVVVPALVEKCFGSSRAGTKAQALELTLQYVEVENGGVRGCAFSLQADILPGLGAKQPKTVSGCVLALKEIVRFCPRYSSHSDKTVRAEGTTLAQTLYQYVGPGIEPWLADLKPVQVKELKESFDAMDNDGKGKGTLKPERLTRAAARDAELAEAASGGDPADAVEEGEFILPNMTYGFECAVEPADMDPRAFAEPVDIVSKLPPALQAGLTSSKWKERKEVLDDLSALLSATPRIKEASELGDLAKSLAVCIQKDANINCVMTAAACMQALAKGMMSSFARYREMVVPVMLERLKERKATVTDSIGLALDAVFSTTTLADIIPDLGTALSSKNPQVKEGTLKFLGRSLASATSPIQPPQVKPLAETLVTLLEDSFEGARNEAANCLGTLMKMVGERPLNAMVEAVADVRKTKIKEAYEKATVKCKAGGAAPPRAAPAAPPPAAAPKKKAPAPMPVVVEDELLESPPLRKPSAKPPARLLARTQSSGNAPAAVAPPPKKAPPPISAKSSKPQAPSAPGTLDTFKFKHTPEDAETLAADAIPSSLLRDLADANWKTRLAALDEMSTWLDGVINDFDAEVLVRALAGKGWSEKNFQVSSKIYGICATLSERCPSFGRSCVALCVPHMSEKLGDMKLKKPAGDALISFAESTSLQFVLNQAYEPLSKQKAPKVLADAIGWMNVALTEFGIGGLSLRSLIDFLKGALQNSNATVRTSATKTLVTVKLFAGSSIKDLLEDLNPQLLNTITAEFDKVEGHAPPDPIRTSADAVSAPAASSGGGSGHVDALDDLFPRVEVDALLKGTTILADAKSDAWKTKKEALETFQSILDQGSNKRLKPNMGEITQVLKARVTDTNKAVQTLTLDIVGRIATGMGKPFEKQCRFFVHPVTTVLSDQKAPIRTAALLTLSAIASACDGLEPMVPGIHSGLETSNPMQKGTLLHWIADWFKEHPPLSSLDLSTWASPIVVSLDDRNADVRKAAQALLPSLITCAGFDYVMQQTNSLKPASRGSAVPLIQAARSAGSPTLPTTAASTQPPKTSKSLLKAAAPELPSSSSPPDSPGTSAPPSRAGGKVSGVRRKLPQGNRPESRSETPTEPMASRALKPPSGALKRPGASSTLARPPVAQALPPPTSSPLFGTNLDSRKARCGKDSHKWVNEGGPTRKDLAELLQNQMESHATKELIGRLFSHDHNAVNDHVAGLTMMCELYNGPQLGDDSVESICLANFDLPLKYASIKAHEPQPNLISKCLEIVETVLAFLRMANQQLTDNEALCFIPTIIFKLGDAREQVRVRVQQIIQDLPKVYAYSRVFQLLLDYGLKSKVAKTRQGSLDEMGSILRKSGMGACEPSKAFPVIATMISDKDSQVRKSALGALSEGYMLVGEKVWSLIGPLPPKDKTQLEERLRRVAGPSSHDKVEPLAPPQVARLAGLPRPGSPATTSRIAGIPRPGSPATNSRIGILPRPASPASRLARPASPVGQRSSSPSTSGPPSRLTRPPIAAPQSPTGLSRPKSLLPSRLGRPRTSPLEESSDITVTISSILSSDPSRSVDALKKVQRILSSGPDAAPFSAQYRELAEHVEGLVETITLQMAHIFERPDDLILDENFRLAKHLIQTLNNFCDHAFLAESLTIDILTSLLEELTLRLLETDDSSVKKIKDLSRFINMIILRLFATGRRMSIFRALFNLLLQVVKPFPSNGTMPDSREAKVAELVLKCVWKLARNIPQDLSEQKLDPVELFPAIEHFLQSVPPNEWRARATNKVPCGDMPLRTVKVIIQHVVAHYGDDVYDLLSASFDDPSATIVYPYVYRILNSSNRPNPDAPRQNGEESGVPRPVSMTSSRPMSPQGTGSEATSHRHSPPSHRSSPSGSSMNGNGIPPPPTEEPDPDVQLLTIIGHISSETTGALHKEGITELHHFLKAYPHKRPRVEKMLESTGAAFRKYINRALASRAAEDQERDVAVADAFDKLEANRPGTSASSRTAETSPMSPTSPQRTSTELPVSQDRLSRLHDLFHYRSSTLSNGSSQGNSAPSETKQSLS
ncbi:microtubule associated protein [Desarmillaria tabescens]|uniref:Microtubule associated protein n=1 Tax=Armillaria tabescens TaxID=1929756 RepID=A0AA39N6I2_ARMTA|nr:microtubule associated protein [Desarmillaria tabescens]KAK0459692.1 microtubule associated protein [Desarmillaria tabescens]